MKEQRGYQHGFSSSNHAMFDIAGRRKKAATMAIVLKEFHTTDLSHMRLLDIGASTGVIDAYLADYFGSVIGIDIDIKAIDHAKNNFNSNNLYFHHGDALNLQIQNESVDVVICSQVYEHVPDADKMIKEIYRVLRPGGICYFSASNRLMWNEPHYNLPLLSVIPRNLAHKYVKISGKSERYHELHLSYWGLKKLVSTFEIIDYTVAMIDDPLKYGIDYMLKPDSFKHTLAKLVSNHAIWLVPGYIWLLKKPGYFIHKKISTDDVWKINN